MSKENFSIFLVMWIALFVVLGVMILIWGDRSVKVIEPNELAQSVQTAQCFRKGEDLVYLSSVSQESETEVVRILESSGWEQVEALLCVENRKEKTRFLFEQNGGNEFYFLSPEKYLFFSGETPVEAKEALAVHLKK